MITIKEVIIVEGKYDKISLSNIVDATIVTTDGFGIFNDKSRQAMIKKLAEKRGVVILTDSDGAGLLIRSKLSGIIPPEKVKHAYIPDIKGKEKRKDRPSKEGYLGVEGMTKEIILDALKRAGCCEENNFGGKRAYSDSITKADLYTLGLTGGENSSAKRKILQKELLLPEKMSTNALLSVLNIITNKDELKLLLGDKLHESL